MLLDGSLARTPLWLEDCLSVGWMDLKTLLNYLSLLQLFKYVKGFCNVKLENDVTFSIGRTRHSNKDKICKPYA